MLNPAIIRLLCQALSLKYPINFSFCDLYPVRMVIINLYLCILQFVYCIFNRNKHLALLDTLYYVMKSSRLGLIVGSIREGYIIRPISLYIYCP